MDKIEHVNVSKVVLTANPAVGKWLNVNKGEGLVTGLIMRADQADADGDRLDAATITKAAHVWAEDGGPGWPVLADHDGPALKDARFVQWGTAETSMSIYGSGGATIPAGAWFAQLLVGPDTLARIVKGELTGFSVEGSAVVKQDDGEELEIDVGDFVRAIMGGVKQGLVMRPASVKAGAAGEGRSYTRRGFGRAC